MLQKWSLLESVNGTSRERILLDVRFRPYSGLYGELCLTVTKDSRKLGLIVKADSEKRCREVEPKTTSLDLEIVRSRLSNCLKSHRLCNALEDYRELELYLLDVCDMCLIPARERRQYVALSYVNGVCDMLKTTTKNINFLRTRGAFSFVDNLAPVVKDTMKLAKDLGYRYLWVDVLCIIQDDAAQKHHQIMQMDLVYRHADLTIVALSGRDANCQLPGLCPNTRPPIRTCYQGREIAFQEVEPSLVAIPTNPNLFIDSSPYESRGWTFQERLLSNRCLYLSSHQAIFQCRMQCVTEAEWTTGLPCEARDDFIYYDPGTGTSTGAFDFPNPLTEFLHNPQSLLMFWNTYRQLVTSYTTRILSYPSDILNAFSGITSILEHYWPTEFVQGLPVSFLTKALFWFHTGLFERRLLKSETGDLSQTFFPSWSWSGWHGAVSYTIESVTTLDLWESAVDSCLCHSTEGTYMVFEHKDPSGDFVWKKIDRSLSTWKPVEALLSRLPQGHDFLWFSPLALSIHRSTFKYIFEGGKQARSDTAISSILDRNGHQCGVLMGNGEYLRPHLESLSMDERAASSYKMILLFRTRPGLAKSRGYTVYLPDIKYLEPFGEYYSNIEPGVWKVCSFMLIRQTCTYYERVTVGILHEKAWTEAGPMPIDIVLL
jgi:hypothetical protein